MSAKVTVRLVKSMLSELHFLEVDGYAGDEPGSPFEELIEELDRADKAPRRSDGSADISLSADAARELIDSLDNACNIWADKATAGGAEALRQSNHIRSGRALIGKLRSALTAAGESPVSKGDRVREQQRLHPPKF